MKKLDTASFVGIIVLVVLALTVGTVIVTSIDIFSGSKSDLTYVTFVQEHNNGTLDEITVGYKDDIVYEYVWATIYPKDVWSEEELEEMKAQYRIYADENKSLKFYKVKIKENGKELFISEIYKDLDKEENIKSLYEGGWLEEAEHMMYSRIESDLLSMGFVKK